MQRLHPSVLLIRNMRSLFQETALSKGQFCNEPCMLPTPSEDEQSCAEPHVCHCWEASWSPQQGGWKGNLSSPQLSDMHGMLEAWMTTQCSLQELPLHSEAAHKPSLKVALRESPPACALKHITLFFHQKSSSAILHRLTSYPQITQSFH